MTKPEISPAFGADSGRYNFEVVEGANKLRGSFETVEQARTFADAIDPEQRSAVIAQLPNGETVSRSVSSGRHAPLKYSVIVVDPPWAYGSSTGRPYTAEANYSTLGNNGREINRRTGAGIESIIQETPVIDLAAPNAHLYLWTTNPKIPFAFDVMRAWGFEYKTLLTWIKTTRVGAVNCGGMGWFFRGATEHVLFGVKGHKPIPAAVRRENVVMAPTVGHSEKPGAFYELLRGVYGDDEQMIDVYARRRHERFEAWGNEVQQPISDLPLSSSKGGSNG